jgi:hypothetical protein
MHCVTNNARLEFTGVWIQKEPAEIVRPVRTCPLEIAVEALVHDVGDRLHVIREEGVIGVFQERVIAGKAEELSRQRSPMLGTAHAVA